MPIKTPRLPPDDERRLTAAEGWLELGNHLKANAELKKVTAVLRAHPKVLRLRWRVYAIIQKTRKNG